MVGQPATPRLVGQRGRTRSQRRHAQLIGVRIGCGCAICVEIMGGDDLCDVRAVVRERRAQMGGDDTMAGLAFTPAEHVVSDVAQHGLHKRVLTTLGRKRVGAYGEHLLGWTE